MFDSIRWIAGGLNIFNLREPAHFRFLSLQGLLIYVLGYVLVVYYRPLFESSCINRVVADPKSIMGACKLGPDVIIVPFVYMVGSFVIISMIKRAEWSADAVFNNVSLLIVIEAVVTGLVYQRGWAAVVQYSTAGYFVALSLAVVAVVAGISFPIEQRSRLRRWPLAVGLHVSPGFIFLIAIYVGLSAGYYYLGFKVTYDLLDRF